jgi:hypothetical protein
MLRCRKLKKRVDVEDLGEDEINIKMNAEKNRMVACALDIGAYGNE